MKQRDCQVDLIAEAYAQARQQSFGQWKRFVAPAKINWYLGVGPVKENGYHQVDTIMHSLLLHDVLLVRPFKRNEGEPLVRLQLSWKSDLEAQDIPLEKNLVYKAVSMLAERLGLQAACGLDLRLEKHIPVQAGLGGGSSDAACALVAAADAWGIALDSPELEDVATKLGSDVPFFLRGGCAYFSDEGQHLEKRLKPASNTVLLFKPDQGVSTVVAYRHFDEIGVFPSEQDVRALAQAKGLEDVNIFNNLEPIAKDLNPALGKAMQVFDDACTKAAAGGLRKIGACHLSGSGSACFALVEDINQAQRVLAALKAAGIWARLSALSAISIQAQT